MHNAGHVQSSSPNCLGAQQKCETCRGVPGKDRMVMCWNVSIGIYDIFYIYFYPRPQQSLKNPSIQWNFQNLVPYFREVIMDLSAPSAVVRWIHK